MTKKKDTTVKPDVINVLASTKDNVLSEKMDPGAVKYLKTGDNLEILLSIEEILKPFISDRMNQLTCRLPDNTPLKLDVNAPAPHGYSMVITLGDWRRLYEFAKSL